MAQEVHTIFSNISIAAALSLTILCSAPCLAQTAAEDKSIDKASDKTIDKAIEKASDKTIAQPHVKGSDSEKSSVVFKPGQAIAVTMETEDIVCTNDVALAAKQREAYPESPEASMVYAVALSRTSQVEKALQEVRRARRLAQKEGGGAYFDQMIETYEKMLTYYPEDNQVRYHLAWAYYMKAYLLVKSSSPSKAGQEATQHAAQSKSPLTTLSQIHNDLSQASPDAVPQIKRYYDLALANLDGMLQREPGDIWARVYRAHLQAEASGDIDTAMVEWQKVKESSPNNPAAYFFLGEGYLKKGNLKESLNNVSKAIALRAIGN
jgi:tetratricopeptide (TPR) repeat protein